jgi:hypothetical protein
MGVVITDTSKLGFIKFENNNYFPDYTKIKEQFKKKADITSVNIIKYGATDCIEIIYEMNKSSYFIHTQSDNFFTVDSVNGIAPTSLEDLRDKIIELL